MTYPISDQTRFFDLTSGLTVESGETLPQTRVAYRTWGEPSNEAILICHALTGSADADEWWEGLFGPSRSFDPDQDFVIASNVLGGCYGTTGPTSTKPGSDRWYGGSFPQVTIRDMVGLQAKLVDHLEVETLRLVIGGSMGGMQALEWAALQPERVKGAVAIGVGAHHSAWSVAFSEAQRAAIWGDPRFQDGDYEPGEGPDTGLAVARMVAMISYRGKANFQSRFARRTVEDEFEVRSYLRHQGRKLVERFDANTYLRLMDAMDSHDLARGRGDEDRVLASIKTPVLGVGISSDILYPSSEVEDLVSRLPNARYQMLHAPQGHDAFLIETANLDGIVSRFKNDLVRGITPADDMTTGRGRSAWI
ncbi:MAG TPA: homoserine O-acetyltransferase [Acidimicrobiia bacterium]|nr:homoserine O-acetyltransferase [Acidimicrobiia bacterium]